MAAVLRPLMGPGTGSPIQMPLLTAMLSAVRDEFERIFLPRNTNVASQQTVAQLVDPTTPISPSAIGSVPHVLVIGTDGTMLKNILADDYNRNFFDLMNNGITAASTIVGHTTMSNPSWTTILTGVWGETAGVFNNVFTPWTYSKYPTVFNQLKTFNPAIQITDIADWEVTAAIGGTGKPSADKVLFVPQIEGDTNWKKTDDKVGDLSVAAIQDTVGAVPSFQFSYFIGVDTNGHMYGADSPEYKAAIRNVNDNLGKIMAAVRAREATGEDWSVIVTTDHGIVGRHTFADRGHGFQSPNETSTFVIADIAGDTCDGCMNNTYRITDITPTVEDLFGLAPKPYFDGVPLKDHAASTTKPVDLHQALNDAIDMYGYPDIITRVVLSLRTIAGIVPATVYEEKHSVTSQLPEELAVPVGILFDGLYVVTNVPAQIFALLTGVTGANIFPLLPPDWPTFPPVPDQATVPEPTPLACGDSMLPAEACIAS